MLHCRLPLRHAVFCRHFAISAPIDFRRFRFSIFPRRAHFLPLAVAALIRFAALRRYAATRCHEVSLSCLPYTGYTPLLRVATLIAVYVMPYAPCGCCCRLLRHCLMPEFSLPLMARCHDAARCLFRRYAILRRCRRCRFITISATAIAAKMFFAQTCRLPLRRCAFSHAATLRRFSPRRCCYGLRLRALMPC